MTHTPEYIQRKPKWDGELKKLCMQDVPPCAVVRRWGGVPIYNGDVLDLEGFEPDAVVTGQTTRQLELSKSYR